VGLLVAASVVAVAVLRNGIAPATPISPGAQVAYSNYTILCPAVPESGCTFGEARTSWSNRPVSTWCTYNATLEHGWNGTYTSTSVSCSPTGILLVFNATQNSTLSGEFSVSGPFQLWLLPQADQCEFEGYLTHNVFLRAEPEGPIPDYPWWNQTYPSANSVNLGNLTFDLAGASAVLPPCLWAFEVVDVGTHTETVGASTALAVAAV
jgi:hypothetical protein